MKIKITALLLSVLIATALFTGCVSAGAETPASLSNAASEQTSESAATTETPVTTNISTPKSGESTASVSEPSSPTANPAETEEPTEEDPQKAATAAMIARGEGAVYIFPPSGDALYYEVGKLPALDSNAYPTLSETRFDDAKLEVENPEASLPTAGMVPQSFVISDEGVFERFDKEILSLSYADTDRAPDKNTSKFYVLTTAEGEKTTYYIHIDGTVIAQKENRLLLADAQLPANRAAYFIAVSLEHYGFYGQTSFCAKPYTSPGQSFRVYVQKDGRIEMLGAEKSAALSSAFYSDKAGVVAGTTRAIDSTAGKTELFRFWWVTSSDRSETGFTSPPADTDLWMRFYDDGTVARVMTSLFCGASLRQYTYSLIVNEVQLSTTALCTPEAALAALS